MKKTWHSHFQVSVLILSSLLLALYSFFFSGKEELLGANPKNGGKNVVALDVSELDKIKKEMTTPVDWVLKSAHRLFVSEKYVYFPDKNIIEEEQQTTMVGPFPLGWLQKYDLPILDLSVATQDPDGDGFTNIMEYNPADPAKGTNPIDPQSHPAYVTKLRVKELKTAKVEFKFTTVQKLDNEDVFSILIEKEEDRRSSMKKKGEKIEGFEVLSYTPKKEVKKSASTGSEEEVDVSELEIENKDLEIKTVLVQGEVKNIPQINASFVLALVDKTQEVIKCERGKVFDLLGEKYRLLDSSAAGAKVKNTTTKEEFLIPSLSADDLRLLPPPVTQKAEKK